MVAFNKFTQPGELQAQAGHEAGMTLDDTGRLIILLNQYTNELVPTLVNIGKYLNTL